MTLGEGKKRVLKLLDEYGPGGGGDPELEIRMADFFDMAQKRLAWRLRIPARAAVERQPGVTRYPLPADFMSLRGICVDGRRSGAVRLQGGALVIPETLRGEVELEYCRIPASLGEESPDSTPFELREDAAACLPYFVAAQCLAGDPVQDGGALMALYEDMVRELPAGDPAEGQPVRNRLFGGGR